jgi:hypothetical protein
LLGGRDDSLPESCRLRKAAAFQRPASRRGFESGDRVGQESVRPGHIGNGTYLKTWVTTSGRSGRRGVARSFYSRVDAERIRFGALRRDALMAQSTSLGTRFRRQPHAPEGFGVNCSARPSNGHASAGSISRDGASVLAYNVTRVMNPFFLKQVRTLPTAMSLVGTKLPNRDIRSTVAIGGKLDMTRTTQLGRK